MADNYLEYARENYEKRKAEWLKRKNRTARFVKNVPVQKESKQEEK